MVRPNFKILNKNAKQPQQAYKNDSGVDFFLSEDVIIPAHGFYVTALGISWAPEWDFSEIEKLLMNKFGESFKDSSLLPPQVYHEFSFMALMFKSMFKISMILKSRSGLSTFKNIEVTTGGVVDEGYVDSIEDDAPILLKLYNHNDQDVSFKVGDKICQGLILLQPNLIGVPIVNEGKRGPRGLGSTGS